jgi:hypothetical protein
MISALSSADVLKSIGRSLRLPSSVSAILSDEMIAQTLRRATHILAPCPAYALARSARQALGGIGLSDEELDSRIEGALEALIVNGDVLEMRAGAEDRWELPDTFELRPAPPAFVVRKNRSVVLLGVAGDEITPLPTDWESMVAYRGAIRILKFDGAEDPRALLRDIGLLELSEKVWLRLPKAEPAKAQVHSWRALLAREPASLPILGLTILDTAEAPTFYRGRWTEPGKQNDGFYVARRPQRYGAARWCVAELERGVLKKFMDLVSPGDRVRPCDLAWRIQAALDAEAGTPQLYRCAPVGATTRIAFFSPLPSWAERQLSIVGDKVKSDGSLYAYDVPIDQTEREISFLREMLWMTDRSDQRESS